ncbi:hypothetical protein PpBr36_06953 [Pyricularia pennisetigena]|uniref:hypothetical protein n=1 Tax=Pyricularia pennisetigena TaxID=1578925 RepID=UPI00114EBDFA|nr:hypothetical protein PpBr36_06953 [Pyricularia pennisetigena]TLS25600.1 hypothetical protein PpBr36_06953 [Pyricularia pennisetigena]
MALFTIGALAAPAASDSGIQRHEFDQQDGLVAAHEIKGAAASAGLQAWGNNHEQRPGKGSKSRPGEAGHSRRRKYKPRGERRVYLVPRPRTLTCPHPQCDAIFAHEEALERHKKLRGHEVQGTPTQ